jgi:hypothetical protein
VCISTASTGRCRGGAPRQPCFRARAAVGARWNLANGRRRFGRKRGVRLRPRQAAAKTFPFVRCTSPIGPWITTEFVQEQRRAGCSPSLSEQTKTQLAGPAGHVGRSGAVAPLVLLSDLRRRGDRRTAGTVRCRPTTGRRGACDVRGRAARTSVDEERAVRNPARVANILKQAGQYAGSVQSLHSSRRGWDRPGRDACDCSRSASAS